MFGTQFASRWLRRRGRQRKPARYRPVVQGLEDRCLLSTFQEFPLPELRRDPADQFHRERITTGPDGALWFTDGVGSMAGAFVGRIASDGTVTEFPIDDHTNTQLYNITAGPDGNLWMLAIRTPSGTDDDQLVVIRMAPDGNYTVFGAFLGHRGEDFVSNVSPLVVGSDGNLWYTASFYADLFVGSIVGRITPTGDVTNFNFAGALAQGGRAGGIIAAPDGNLWVSINDGTHGEAAGVQRFSLDGHLSDVIPRSRAVAQMVVDANGNVWGLIGAGPFGSLIERIAPDGAVRDFPLPASEPVSPPELNPSRMTITVGPDGNIWFSDPYANQIGNIAPDGAVTEYAVPSPDSFPAGITTGPDGNIWFTELGSNQIGEFVLNDGGAPGAAGLGQALRVAAADAAFAGARLDTVNGVSGQPSAAAGAEAASAVHRTAALPSLQTQPTAAGVSGLQHHAHGTAAADIAGLADPLGRFPC